MALALLGVASTATAQADDAWSGASASNHNWSDPDNWTGGVTPSGATGTLQFPDLGSCTACYTANNDLTGLSASALTFSNTTPGSAYHVLGSGLTLGSGGLSDVGGGSTSATLNIPLTLSAPQTWSIGAAGSYNSVTLTPPATTGGAFPLGVVFPASSGSGDLWIDRDMEVGPVTVTGRGGLHIGLAPSVPNRTPGSVNGSDGSSVAVDDSATLVANPGSTTGPLSFDGGSLLLGTGPTNQQSTTLEVNGDASLASATQSTILFNDDGTDAGTDYSQLSATGKIALGGKLNVDQGPSGGGCVNLSPGDVATLVTTNGTLSGRFTNAPDGSILTMASSCESPAPRVLIAYSANCVTATVVGAPPGPTSPCQAPSVLPAPPTTTVPASTPTTTVSMPTPTSTPKPKPKLRPSATTTQALHVGATHALLTGKIATQGAAVTWRFAYSAPGCATRMSSPHTIAAGRTRPVAVSATVSKLTPDVRYRVRLIVRSAAGTEDAKPSSFQTADTGRLLVLGRRLSLSADGIGVSARCASGLRCAGRLTITTTVRAAKRSRPAAVACARGAVHIAAHHGARLRAQVTAACRAILARAAGHQVVVTVTASTRTGQRGPRRRLTLAWRRTS